jgi:hypothetical protein
MAAEHTRLNTKRKILGQLLESTINRQHISRLGLLSITGLSAVLQVPSPHFSKSSIPTIS